MNIFEYNEEKVLRMTKEEGYELGHQEGQQQKLIQQITKKLQRNQSIEQIADDLCEPIEVIQALVLELDQK